MYWGVVKLSPEGRNELCWAVTVAGLWWVIPLTDLPVEKSKEERWDGCCFATDEGRWSVRERFLEAGLLLLLAHNEIDRLSSLEKLVAF